MASAEYMTKYREKNRQKYNEYMRNWNTSARIKDPEGTSRKRRVITLKNRYGITMEEYGAMLLAQGGHCFLCDRTPDQERYGYLNVDHCHETGRIRGLLCTVHNSAIAALGDSAEGLMRAVAYLNGPGGV